MRIHLESPVEPGGDVYDSNLVNMGPDPQRIGLNLGKRLTALEANTMRVLVTSSRSFVENSNADLGTWKKLHMNDPVDCHLLHPIGPKCPYFENQPEIWILFVFCASLNMKYYLPSTPSFQLPNGHTYATLARALLSRIAFRNPYDGPGKYSN